MNSRISKLLLRFAWIAASLFLAYPMASHGWMKIKPSLTQTDPVPQNKAHSINSKAEQTANLSESAGPSIANQTMRQATASENPNVDKRRRYIRGMKATGYLWDLIGALDLLGAILLLVRPVNFLGSAILWPITLNVFLFHLLLEPEETGELLFTTAMMAVNTALIFRHWSKWRHLLYINITS